MRLDKYLAETAQCTRSEAKALLAKGRVTVNVAVCKKGDTQLKEADAVAVDGKALASQGKHTPFLGYELAGQVRATVVRGRVAFQR